MKVIKKFLNVGVRIKGAVRRAGSHSLIGSFSKDVFERHTSTGSEVLSLFTCPDATKFVLLSFFSLIKRIYPRVSTKPLHNDTKSPLPVDVRSSAKMLMLKLPSLCRAQTLKCTTYPPFYYGRVCRNKNSLHNYIYLMLA